MLVNRDGTRLLGKDYGPVQYSCMTLSFQLTKYNELIGGPAQRVRRDFLRCGAKRTCLGMVCIGVQLHATRS